MDVLRRRRDGHARRLCAGLGGRRVPGSVVASVRGLAVRSGSVQGTPCPPPPGVSMRSRPPAASVPVDLLGTGRPSIRSRPGRPGLAACRATWAVPATLGDQRVGHLAQGLQLAHNPVPAPMRRPRRPSRGAARTRAHAAGTRAPAPRSACSACCSSRRAPRSARPRPGTRPGRRPASRSRRTPLHRARHVPRGRARCPA